MIIEDLRNVFTSCRDELIEVSGDFIYYAEEKMEEGHNIDVYKRQGPLRAPGIRFRRFSGGLLHLALHAPGNRIKEAAVCRL